MKSEERLRYEIGKCGRCEICRELVEGSCLFFPEMFRLVDAERDTGREISTESLFRLVGLCNFCGICPCRDIRDAILAFKTGYMDRNGLGFRVRMLESVQTVGKVGGTCPGVANFLLQNGATGGIVKNMLGIHRDCGFPLFPVAGFPRWMKDRENGRPLTGGEKGKVAYFTGCTARYFFPEVARAVVEVLEKNGAEVHIPEQQCCGMPSMLEGDRNKTLELAKANVDLLTGLIDRGYDIVTSCPTCGYMLKVLLRAGAENAGKQLNVRDRENGFVEIDIEKDHMELKPVPGGGTPVKIQKKFLDRLMEDSGYFHRLDPAGRVKLAGHTCDLGEYLGKLHVSGGSATRTQAVRRRALYYPPCHLREQRIDSPYMALLGEISGLDVQAVQGVYCCGNAGIMGMKKEFHRSAIKIASPLIAKIKQSKPDVLVTDCLSCRMQFENLLDIEVRHPIELIHAGALQE